MGSAENIYEAFTDGLWSLRKRDFEQAHFFFSRAFWWTRQYLKLGFCEADLWCLETHLAELIAPRLRKFAEWFEGRSRPPNLETSEEWVAIVNKIARAFEIVAADCILSREEVEEAEEGLDLFRKYFRDLWD